jgi:hypothetical protein
MHPYCKRAAGDGGIEVPNRGRSCHGAVGVMPQVTLFKLDNWWCIMYNPLELAVLHVETGPVIARWNVKTQFWRSWRCCCKGTWAQAAFLVGASSVIGRNIAQTVQNTPRFTTQMSCGWIIVSSTNWHYYSSLEMRCPLAWWSCWERHGPLRHSAQVATDVGCHFLHFLQQGWQTTTFFAQPIQSSLVALKVLQ